LRGAIDPVGDILYLYIIHSFSFQRHYLYQVKKGKKEIKNIPFAQPPNLEHLWQLVVLWNYQLLCQSSTRAPEIHTLNSTWD
jgi:hypothetical protein